jgi:xanthine dehydrogenase accessory factor
LEVWQFIYDKLLVQQDVILLWVLDSEGSSPGRRGFKLAVASDGNFCGTIGGGIMEHKLVEKAKALLSVYEKTISLLQQHHDKEHSKDQSGMICSGNQTVAFVPLSHTDLSLTNKILASQNNRTAVVHLSSTGISLSEEKGDGLQYKNKTEWHYSEPCDNRPVIHIIGGGHVGLALSELMLFLGFYIKVYDNRSGLNTMQHNHFAHEKHIVDYKEIGNRAEIRKEDFIAVVTFSYRDDKIVLSQLLHKEFYYLGVMGSDAKIKTLVKELGEEGISPNKWSGCFLPIGINIYSKTTREIAVSIAAQIILEKNKTLPTGRIEK